MKKIILAVGALLGVLMLFLSSLIGISTSLKFQASASEVCGSSVLAGAPGAADGNGQIPAAYKADIAKAAKVSGMPESLLAAQIQAESGWNPKAVSPVGAKGIAQFMPGTWAAYSKGADPFDPHAGIRAQGELMRDLMKMMRDAKLPGNVEDLALTAYNWGQGNVLSHGGIPSPLINYEAGTYAKKIREIQKTYLKSGSSTEPIEASASPSSSAAQDEAQAESDLACSGVAAGAEVVSFKPSASDNYYGKTAPHCTMDGTGAYTGCPAGSVSDLGMYFRECTDFALFRVNEQITGRVKPPFAITNGNFRPDGVGLGDATMWLDGWKAKGWKYDKKPQVGSVVYYAAGHPNAPGSHGHVAIVKAVYSDGTYLEEGYNFGLPPTDHQYYTIKHKNEVPSAFLHLPKAK